MSDRRFIDRIVSPELLTDEDARAAFKAQKHAVRRDLVGHPFVPLTSPREAPVVRVGDRRSHRLFGSAPVGFADLSELLSVLCARAEDGGEARRGYASAGGAYPVQAYVLATGDVEGVPAGLYYHHPEAHRLVLVDARAAIALEDQFPTNRAWVGRAKLLVVLAARMGAIRPLYGQKARDFALLEAGQMVQLLQAMSARCAVGLCQAGLLDDGPLGAAIGLGEGDEIVAVLAGGAIPRATTVAQTSLAVAPARVEARAVVVAQAAAAHVQPPAAVVAPAPAAVVLPASGAAVLPALAPAPASSGAASSASAAPPPRASARARRIEEDLGALWRELLGRAQVDPEAQFFDIGATSIVAARAVRALRDRYPAVELGVVDVFSHPTIRDLAAAIDARLAPEASSPAASDASSPLASEASAPPTPGPAIDVAPPARATSAPPSAATSSSPASTLEPAAPPRARATARGPGRTVEPIAIIGMAVEVPGADTLDRLWSNLLAGRSFVGPIPEARRALVPDFVTRPDQRFVAAYLDAVDTFPPLFFHMSPREAERVDPAQRLMLMVAAQAVAHAGYWRDQLAGARAGVFVGASHTGYAELCGDQADLTRMLPGNMTSIVAGRISHFFDLRGPSLVIDTACSSSLVAVDQACRALSAGDVELAIAGGVNVILSPRPFEAFRQDGMESQGGACRTFDARADGFVRGEGAAALVLKPLGAALADGDHVHAVIRGTATTHDGRTTALPVPSPRAQEAAIREAHRRGGTSPREIGYVEAHGTGTSIGDPIELRGLTEAFRTDVSASAVCGIGSIKTNLGHLEMAAGVVGLVKAVLALEREVVPPSLHFEAPNPHLELERTPFYVVDRARPWPRHEAPRLAGVSSFGVGGTNAHAVLEEAPARAPEERRWAPAQLLVLSADRPEALWRSAREHVHALARGDLELADVCATLATGRPMQAHRLAIVASDREAMLAAATAAVFAEGRALPGLRVSSGQVEDPVSASALAQARERLARLPAAAQRAARAWLAEGSPFEAASEADVALASLDRAAWLELLELVGGLWVRGVRVRFGALIGATSGGRARRAPLPPLPLTRERCWWPAPMRAASVARAESRIAAPVPSEPPPLAEPAIDTRPPAPAPATATVDLAAFLRGTISEAMRIPLDDVGLKQPLVELGMDSLAAVELLDRLGVATGQSFPPSFFFEHPTIEQMAAALEARDVRLTEAAAGPRRGPSEPARQAAIEPGIEPARAIDPLPSLPPRAARAHGGEASRAVAIVGMAGRFPGARDLASYWALLREGRHAITPVPAERWAGGDLRGGFLDDLDVFDPRFFRLSDREARWMDPQHRLLLMTAWEAIEDAGLARAVGGSRTGVYVGASYTHRRDRLTGEGHQVDEAHAALGNHNAILANRLSYFLDARGPCLTVDTLCSSSLVALHTALSALRTGECTQALVAGVHADLSPAYYRAVSRLGALSADGRCRAFGAGASGYVPGEGVAAVVLKPLDRALADRDHLHAVIRGAAINHGGQAAGLTVPNPAAQAEVVRAALADAGVDGASLSYVEAHGTGTELGDPIELSGLVRALGQREVGACAIGSVKSNIGHLEPAAGLASLVKVALMLRYRTIVPTLWVERPNPRLELASSPVRLAAALEPWRPRAGVRRAGISSFGLGGVNAHVIVEEAPARAVSPDRAAHVVPLSAPSADQLLRAVERWAAFVAEGGAHATVRDLAHSAIAGRAALKHRAAVIAADVAGLQRGLCELAARLRRREAAGVAHEGADGALLERARRFVAGDDGALAPIDGAWREPLPPTPLELRRFEYPGAPPSASPPHPLIGAPTRTDGVVTFELELPVEVAS